MGGRWNEGSQRFVPDLVRLRALRAPPAVRSAAAAGRARRWWGALSGFFRGDPARRRQYWAWPPWPAAPQRVLDLATNEGASRLPLRP